MKLVRSIKMCMKHIAKSTKVNIPKWSKTRRHSLSSVIKASSEVKCTSSPGMKQPGHEGDYSPPSSAMVKKTWIYKSTLPYAFMV
jgi:hypothetical protein